MPIQENKKLYPANWKEIVKQVKDRANGKCEFCGLENYSVGFRVKDIFFKIENSMQGETDTLDFESEGYKPIKIVLTVAHLDHDPQNNDFSNLKALCQQCHLRLDVEQHKQTRAKNKHKLNFKLDL